MQEEGEKDVGGEGGGEEGRRRRKGEGEKWKEGRRAEGRGRHEKKTILSCESIETKIADIIFSCGVWSHCGPITRQAPPWGFRCVLLPPPGNKDSFAFIAAQRGRHARQ